MWRQLYLFEAAIGTKAHRPIEAKAPWHYFIIYAIARRSSLILFDAGGEEFDIIRAALYFDDILMMMNIAMRISSIAICLFASPSFWRDAFMSFIYPVWCDIILCRRDILPRCSLISMPGQKYVCGTWYWGVHAFVVLHFDATILSSSCYQTGEPILLRARPRLGLAAYATMRSQKRYISIFRRGYRLHGLMCAISLRSAARLSFWWVDGDISLVLIATAHARACMRKALGVIENTARNDKEDAWPRGMVCRHSEPLARHFIRHFQKIMKSVLVVITWKYLASGAIPFILLVYN